jgi:hypothetical protein
MNPTDAPDPGSVPVLDRPIANTGAEQKNRKKGEERRGM